MNRLTIKKFLIKHFPILQFIKHSILIAIYKYRNVGRGAYIDNSVHVLGWRAVRIGFNSVISEASWLNVNNPQFDRVQIVIEENCFIGRRNFMSSGYLIRLGAYCLTGPDCKFLGSDHIITDPFKPYVATGATVDSTIEIGANCWFGTGAVVLGSVKIGHGSIIGVNTLINSDIPPFSLVVGTPGRVVKRFRISTSSWIPAAQLTATDAIALPSESEYLEILRANHSLIYLPTNASGKRMGDLP